MSFLIVDADRPRLNPHGIIRTLRLVFLTIIIMSSNTIPTPALLLLDALPREMCDGYRLQPQGDLLVQGRDHERREETRSESAQAGKTSADDGDVGLDYSGRGYQLRPWWKWDWGGKHTTRGS